MSFQRAIAAALGAVLLAIGSATMAADYRPDEFLSLDLSKAVLSPKPLGPQTEFAPVPVEAKSEPSGVLPHADTRKVPIAKVRGAPARAEWDPAARREQRRPAPALHEIAGSARDKILLPCRAVTTDAGTSSGVRGCRYWQSRAVATNP